MWWPASQAYALDAIAGATEMSEIDENMWFVLCNISMNPTKSDILKRWIYYKDTDGNYQRELLGQMKITVEMMPLPEPPK